MIKKKLPRARVVTAEEKPYSERELAFLEYMKGKTAEDIFPEKTKRAHDNLKRAGLIS